MYKNKQKQNPQSSACPVRYSSIISIFVWYSNMAALSLGILLWYIFRLFHYILLKYFTVFFLYVCNTTLIPLSVMVFSVYCSLHDILWFDSAISCVVPLGLNASALTSLSELYSFVGFLYSFPCCVLIVIYLKAVCPVN